MFEVIRSFVFQISVVGRDKDQIRSSPPCLEERVKEVSVFEVIERESACLSVERVLRVHGGVVVFGLAVDVPGVSSGVGEVFFLKKSGSWLYLG